MRDIWKRNKHVDLWTFVHILSGWILGTFFIYKGTPFYRAFIYTALILIAWEIIEYLFKNTESLNNRIVDVVSGSAGFALLIWSDSYDLAFKSNYFNIISAAWLTLCISGWWAVKRRLNALNKGDN